MSPQRRALGLAATALGTALKALFWCAMAAEVAWLVLAALALSSGMLVLFERRASPYDEPEREWTPAETLYALVLSGSLFFGVYAFLGWYYSP